MNSTINLTREEILRHVAETMNQVLGVPLEKITERSRLVEDLGVDSLDAVEVVMALEDRFQAHFEDVDRNKILTIEDIVGYVSRQLTNSSLHPGSAAVLRL